MIYGLRDIVSTSFGASEYRDNLRTGEFWAVDDIDFELQPGECLGLIGHNGAGKTTLLKMLNGLIKPDRGRIEMRGRVGALIALGAGFNPILTGRENIYINGSILGMKKREIDAKFDEIVAFAEVEHAIDAPVRNYSSGMTVRLGFAIAAKCEPDILLLDEVLAVGDIGFQAKCFNTLAKYRERGTAFILVSHNMHHIERYCDRTLYLSEGRIKHYGATAECIQAFTADMESGSASQSDDATDWDTVYGNGLIAFTSAHFEDAEGARTTKIPSGAPVTLAIRYQTGGLHVPESLIDVGIRDHEGIFYQANNFGHDQKLGDLSQANEIRIAFKSLPSNSSRLRFSFTIMDAKTREVYDWKRNVILEIERNPRITGRAALEVDWKTAKIDLPPR